MGILPTIHFLPTTLFAYCTGTLLSPSCNATTIAIITRATNANRINFIADNCPMLTNCIDLIISAGILDIIPTKIINEIPLPIPLSVIRSPTQIKNEVPAIKDTIIIVFCKKTFCCYCRTEKSSSHEYGLDSS